MSRFLHSSVSVLAMFLFSTASGLCDDRPNVVLVMADDMGWGQTGYYNHPALKTPHLDAMAANGLRFDRFYAGAPNCSPTRATVMTGRTNDRTGVTNHGVPLRPQEITLPQLLSDAGYSTAHFGKWHLNGLRGVGAPVLKDDIRSPGAFGFSTWLSTTNFFDRNPILSRNGEFEEFEGDSSEIVVDEAMKFITETAKGDAPFFVVIWYGTPHSPFVAVDSDKTDFNDLNESSANHYGELVAMDRSIGTLRKGLKDLKLSDNTLFWFNSDNGGLPKLNPDTVGGLRGYKGSVYEGGLRVPAVIEWPAKIKQPRITNYTACTMDILPTVLAATGTTASKTLPVLDGESLMPLFNTELRARRRPIGFRHTNRSALIYNQYKLVKPEAKSDELELYDLEQDPSESKNLIDSSPDIAKKMKDAWTGWNKSVDDSVLGLDYPEKKVIPVDPGPRNWETLDMYRPWFAEWKDRPEYKGRLK